MYAICSLIVSLILSGVSTFFQFFPFYGMGTAELPYIFAVMIAAMLPAVLPAVRIHGKVSFFLCAIFPYCFCTVYFYNNVFSILPFIAALPLLPLALKKKRRSLILFTESGTPLEIKRVTRRGGTEVYSFVANGVMALTILLCVLTLVFPVPTKYWFARRFPQTGEPLSETVYAVPSGQVTESVWLDEKALNVAGFFDVETTDGSVPSPAREAGLKEGDAVTEINGEPALDSSFITDDPDGSECVFTIKRLNNDKKVYETFEIKITPALSSEGLYRIGMKYYSGAMLAASIQTMSFYHPESGLYAATAHDVTEVVDTVDNLKGYVYKSVVVGRNENGLDVLPYGFIGEVTHMSGYGSFGKLTDPEDGELLPIAKKREVKRGKAILRSSFESDSIEEYDVFITGTYRIAGRDVLTVIIEDERILSAGGVTRGMSGSPIIQNGKIVAALSNMDAGGISAYATYACDMESELRASQGTAD